MLTLKRIIDQNLRAKTTSILEENIELLTNWFRQLFSRHKNIYQKNLHLHGLHQD